MDVDDSAHPLQRPAEGQHPSGAPSAQDGSLRGEQRYGGSSGSAFVSPQTKAPPSLVNSAGETETPTRGGSLSPHLAGFPPISAADFNKQRSLLVPKKATTLTALAGEPSSAASNNAAHATTSTTPPANTSITSSASAAQSATKNAIRPKASTSSTQQLEQRKNEIVAEMLAKLRPFVDASTGVLSESANLDAFAELMATERQFVQKTLLLTVLLNRPPNGDAGKDAIYQRIVQSDRMLEQLLAYTTDALKDKSMLILKLLDLLLRLPMTVTRLVDFKFGKPVKRLMQATAEELNEFVVGAAQEAIRMKAKELFDAWTALARQEDSRRRVSEDLDTQTASKAAAPQASSKRQKAEAAVENRDFFDAPPPSFPVTSKSAAILERVARGEKIRPSALDTRPLSADDIHKAKKKRLYLEQHGQQSADSAPVGGASPAVAKGPTDGSTAGPASRYERHAATSPADARPARPSIDASQGEGLRKKRVSFPDTADQLCQIRYYEPDGDDEGPAFLSASRGKTNGDKSEASFAFDQLRKEMQAELEWTEPASLSLLPSASSTTAFAPSKRRPVYGGESWESKEDPREALEEDASSAVAGLRAEPVIIPVREREAPLGVPQVRKIPRDPAATGEDAGASPVSAIDPSLLSSLLSNPSLLHNIMASSGAAPPFGLGPLPLFGFPPLHHEDHRPQQQQKAAGKQNRHDKPNGHRKQRAFIQSAPSITCKFYKPGKQDSCRWKGNCKFKHVDRP